jgi:putative hydrolase of the HAD superfamily
MNPIRAVFLDAGGTLIHLDERLILEVLAGAGSPRDAVAYRAADLAARRAVSERMRRGELVDDRTRWRIWAETLLSRLECTELEVDAVRASVRSHSEAGRLWSRIEPGTVAALDALRRDGLVVSVVSNSDGRVEGFLATAGLLPHLDFVIDSAVVGVEKPDPRVFAIACARAGVPPDQAIHVGDVYEVDVLGARAAGLTPVLFDPDDMVPDADCARIRRLDELPGWLRTRRAA